ncbi:hypothetical protein ABZX66_28160 [Micromonospora aurantiaca]|uniref:hypothetical protein n=1 Tax=Micromonospora aurantiaca (nom. illeg.) TaxID=47850 RepID=UPI0033AC1172
MANEPTSKAGGTPPPAPKPAAARPEDKPAARVPATTPGADAGPVNPAGEAIRTAAEKAETERLTQRRKELRELIGDAPTLAVLRAEVNALEQAAARAGVTGATRYTMSAGVAADLEQSGYAVDPTTGDAYVRDGDRVTVTARTGETRTVDMPAPAGGDSGK